MGGSRGPPVLHRGAGDSTTRYVGAESAGLGSIGDPYDNASPESCIGTINNELGKRRVFRTRDQTRRSERLTIRRSPVCISQSACWARASAALKLSRSRDALPESRPMRAP